MENLLLLLKHIYFYIIICTNPQTEEADSNMCNMNMISHASLHSNEKYKGILQTSFKYSSSLVLFDNLKWAALLERNMRILRNPSSLQCRHIFQLLCSSNFSHTPEEHTCK